MAIGSLNGSSLTGIKTLNSISRSLTKSFEKLSSGSRIPRASFDAAGLAISERLQASSTSMIQGVRNLNDGISATRIAEGALDESSNVLVRLRELSIQAQNGTLNDQQRQVIQQEFDSLSGQLSDISSNTSFNGKKLLDGSENIEVVDGSGGEPMDIATDDQSAAALGVEGLDAADPSSLAQIDQAIRSVSSARASLGATENRISSQIRGQMVAIENTVRANSQIRDADFAKESSELLRNQVMRQANIAVRSQANIGAGVALKLLG
ncbi:MAG: flagellin FliC [bacterium]|nr:flagellin FliC [bacterium]